MTRRFFLRKSAAGVSDLGSAERGGKMSCRAVSTQVLLLCVVVVGSDGRRFAADTLGQIFDVLQFFEGSPFGVDFAPV
jgi:hypothetical protein